MTYSKPRIERTSLRGLLIPCSKTHDFDSCAELP
jgi:hypothetical protein